MLTPEAVSELRALKALHDEGILVDAEYSAKKAQILGLAPECKPKPAQQSASAPAPARAGAKTGVELKVADAGGSKGAMVTGDTLRAKVQLKSMGARWDPKLVAWMFANETADSVASKLRDKGFGVTVEGEDGEATAAERRESELRSERDTALAHGASAAAHAELTLSRHKRAVLLCGETQKVKDMLRVLDGKWIRSLGGYCFPGSKKDELLSALRADPTNRVADQTDQPSTGVSEKPASRRKRGRRDDEDFIDDDEAYDDYWE